MSKKMDDPKVVYETIKGLERDYDQQINLYASLKDEEILTNFTFLNR